MAENADATIERWFSPSFARKAPDQVAAVHERLKTTSPHGYAASCAALRDMDLREALPRISRPVLVISGKDDPVIPDTDIDAMVAAIANARHVPLNARHISNIEAEDAFTKACLRFLLAKRLRSAPGQAGRRLAAKRSDARVAVRAKAPAKKVRKAASKSSPSRRPVAGKKLVKARTSARQAVKRASAVGKSRTTKSGASKSSAARKGASKTAKRAVLRRPTPTVRGAVKKVAPKKTIKSASKKLAAKKSGVRKAPASRRTPRKAPRRPIGRRKT